MPGPENPEEMNDIFTVTKEGFIKIVSKDISPHRNLEEQEAAYFAGFTIKCIIKKHNHYGVFSGNLFSLFETCI